MGSPTVSIPNLLFILMLFFFFRFKDLLDIRTASHSLLHQSFQIGVLVSVIKSWSSEVSTRQPVLDELVACPLSAVSPGSLFMLSSLAFSPTCQYSLLCSWIFTAAWALVSHRQDSPLATIHLSWVFSPVTSTGTRALARQSMAPL